MATGYAGSPSAEYNVGGKLNADGNIAPGNQHGTVPKGPAPVSGIRPPAPMQVSRGVIDNWKTWKQIRSNYGIVTQLQKQTPAYHTALFLHAIGSQGLEIYNSFNFPNEDNSRDLDKIIKAFDKYAIGEVNETYERYLFNKRQQESGESFETYLAALRSLAKTCNFCECMSSSLLRDKIVLGIGDSNTRKRLLQERKLTLSTCIDICKSVESAESQLKAFKAPPNTNDGAQAVHRVMDKRQGSKQKIQTTVEGRRAT